MRNLITLIESAQPKYRFVTTCVDSNSNGPNGEAIYDMRRANHGIIDFNDIMQMIGPAELEKAGLDPSTLADDWAVSWEQSVWRGIPCIYIVQSGIEHIFTPNGEHPGPWQDDDLTEKAKAPTIASCTKSNGEINRAKADRILDPKGYFKNKKKISEKIQDDVVFYGYHGTSSVFLNTILERGLSKDPEKRVHDKESQILVPYEGTYFSDSPAVALWAGDRAVSAFGGKHIIVICGITHDIRDTLAGDEDAVIEFIDNFNPNDWQDSDDTRSEEECWDVGFYNTFDCEMPHQFLELLKHPEQNDPMHRKYMDIVTRYIGASTKSSGNYESVSFRVPNGVGIAHIAAIIECQWLHEELDGPDRLPDGFGYKIIYGNVNPKIRKALSGGY